MPIKKEQCIIITCDCCGELLEHNGYSLFVDENDANSSAECADWIEDNGKYYCPSCYKIDDDDNIIIESNKLNKNLNSK